MQVTIQLPEDISAALEVQWDNVSRRSLEAIAIEGHRTGGLTEAQVLLIDEAEAITDRGGPSSCRR